MISDQRIRFYPPGAERRDPSPAAPAFTLLFLSIPIAIAANAFRVAGTGFLAHFIGPEAAQGFYHSFAGWIVFAVAFALLLGAGTLLGRLPDGGGAQEEAQP